MEKYYEIQVAGVTRRLPIIQIAEDLAIASFVLLGDCEMAHAAAQELKNLIPQADWLITAEAKGIALAQELAVALGMPRYVVARKSVKSYMENVTQVTVNSITTQKEQTLCLDGLDAERIRGKRVLLVDDVISTGESVRAIRALAEKAGAIVVGEVCILTEGDPEDHKDVIRLGNIPLFPVEK